MNEELIEALENRLEHGEDKESLRAEVIAAGHSHDSFEDAFSEANRRYQMSGGGEDSEISFSDTVVEEATDIPRSRARGDLHTLEIIRKPKNSGLIGYTNLLKAGWQIGNEGLRLLGGLLAAFIILGVIAVVLVLAITGYIASDVFDGSNATLITLLGLVILGYLAAIVYISMAGFAFFRGLILRKEGIKYWSHFRWSWRHIVPIFLLSFYIQIITQAGFVLFVIPGFIAMVYLGYAQYLLAHKSQGGFGSLISSFELVYGRFWAILGRKLFLIAIIFIFAFLGALLLSLFPALGLLGLLAFVASLYVVFCSTIALYESVAAAKPVYVCDDHSRASLKKWLLIMVLVGTLFGAISFFGMISDIDSSQEFPEIERIIDSIRKNKVENIQESPVVMAEETNAAQIKLITSYVDQISAVADLYKETNGTFAGVCSDEDGVNTLLRYAYDSGSNDIFCHDDRGWYIAEAELGNSGAYYCVDSTGNSLVQQYSKNGYETCLDTF